MLNTRREAMNGGAKDHCQNVEKFVRPYIPNSVQRWHQIARTGNSLLASISRWTSQKHTTADITGESQLTNLVSGKENAMPDEGNNSWFEDYAEEADDLQVEEYDITAAPNDFNVLTINSFLESGAVRIPGFQRNFVWDIGRSSKAHRIPNPWIARSAGLSLRGRSQQVPCN